MKNFFATLERAAERLVNAIDGNVQDPLVKMMNGDVFTDATSAPNLPHTYEGDKPETAYPPLVQPTMSAVMCDEVCLTEPTANPHPTHVRQTVQGHAST